MTFLTIKKAEKLADHFSEIPYQYDEIKTEDINVDPINKNYMSRFETVQIWWIRTELTTNKSIVRREILSKAFHEFAAHK